jgi:glycine/serine hydroxymethyltransferase
MNGIPDDPRAAAGDERACGWAQRRSTTRGLREANMDTVAGFIDAVLGAGLKGEAALATESAQVRESVRALCRQFPLPH